MNKSYKRRPQDFKRKILSRVYTSRIDMMEEEHRWLSMIKDHELKKKYYNVHNHLFGHWSLDPELAKEVLAKMSEAGKNISGETRQKMSDAKKGKSLSPATQFQPGFEPWNKGKKGSQEAWNKGLTGDKSHVKGRVVSEETRRKISEAQKGKPRPAGSGMTGRKHSAETKLKISNNKRNKASITLNCP